MHFLLTICKERSEINWFPGYNRHASGTSHYLTSYFWENLSSAPLISLESDFPIVQSNIKHWFFAFAWSKVIMQIEFCMCRFFFMSNSVLILEQARCTVRFNVISNILETSIAYLFRYLIPTSFLAFMYLFYTFISCCYCFFYYGMPHIHWIILCFAWKWRHSFCGIRFCTCNNQLIFYHQLTNFVTEDVHFHYH